MGQLRSSEKVPLQSGATSRGEVAESAESLGEHGPDHFTNAANLTGTLGSDVRYEGASIADAYLQGAQRWNANLSTVDSDPTK